MITLEQFNDLQSRIKYHTRRASFLSTLLEQVNAFQDLIYGEDTYSAVGYKIQTAIDSTQDSLEELYAVIESEIKASEGIAEEYNREMITRIYTDKLDRI